jgi:hypothetical protein
VTAIVLFIHRRADSTRLIFSAIREFSPEKLYVFADGPRPSMLEGELVSSARLETENVDWPCEVFRKYQNENLGLAESIITGLDIVFERETSAIILEDDCLPSQSFFPFMEKLLDRYADCDRVGLISGSNLSGISLTTEPYFFAGHPYIWGWGTWSRAWRDFRESPKIGRSFRVSNKAMSGVFNKILFWNLLAKEASLGTWDIAFARYIHQNQLLCAIPSVNLVENIGFDSLSTHSQLEEIFVTTPRLNPKNFSGRPPAVIRNSKEEIHISRTMFRRLLVAVIRNPALFGQILRRLMSTKK